MKTPAQKAFEAYQAALAVHGLHGNNLATSHLQPWESLDSRQQQAWQAVAKALKA